MRKTYAALCGALILGTAGAAWGAPPIPDAYKTGGFAIGCQAWSFNRFTAFEAIQKTAETGGKVIEFFPGQALSPDREDVKMGPDMPEEAIALLKEQLKKYGVKAVAFGVTGIPRDEARARKYFEFAKKLGIRVLVTESTESIDTIEKLVKEYDICVGYHNHPRRPNNPNYKVWNPKYILQLVKGRDPRIGSTSDTGHWMRSGLDPVECLRLLKGRVISLHLKDLDRMGPNAHDVPYGTGAGKVKEVLDELRAQGFQGNISIEYEYDWDNNVPKIAQCIGFVRGYGAAIGK